MKKVAGELKLLYSQYRELQSFAQFGSDLDADTKSRLALGERIVEVLKQNRNAPVRVGCQIAIVYAVINHYLDNIPVKKVANYERKFYNTLCSQHEDLLKRLESGSWEESDMEQLKSAISTVKE